MVAVIGDGALTGGIAYEALNHAGHLGIPVLVVLNDNTMSIEKNVGAMSTYLSRLRTEPTLYRFRRDMERRLQRLPGVGDRVAAMGEQLKDSIKAALVPGMLFEDLGFTYVGVIDGHDIEELRREHPAVAGGRGPGAAALPHRQGQGLRARREAARPLPRHAALLGGDRQEPRPGGPDHVHAGLRRGAGGVGPQRRARRGHHRRHGGGHRADLLREALPERFFDVGIAEAHAVAFAAGLAAAGKRPVVAIYSTFLQRAYDQIIHDVCLQGLPVVFAVDRAGLVGEDGPTHHGAFDLSFLRIIPGLTVFVPKHEAELQRMLATALTLDGPSVIRYPRSAGSGRAPRAAHQALDGPWVEVVRSGRGRAAAGGRPVVALGLRLRQTSGWARRRGDGGGGAARASARRRGAAAAWSQRIRPW